MTLPDGSSRLRRTVPGGCGLPHDRRVGDRAAHQEQSGRLRLQVVTRLRQDAPSILATAGLGTASARIECGHDHHGLDSRITLVLRQPSAPCGIGGYFDGPAVLEWANRKLGVPDLDHAPVQVVPGAEPRAQRC
jgi:hypothetical protein